MDGLEPPISHRFKKRSTWSIFNLPFSVSFNAVFARNSILKKEKRKNNQRVEWFKINHRICRCITLIKIKGREKNKKWRQSARTPITRGSTEPYMLHARSFPNVRVTFIHTASPPLTARVIYTLSRHTYKREQVQIICTRIGRQNTHTQTRNKRVHTDARIKKRAREDRHT